MAFVARAVLPVGGPVEWDAVCFALFAQIEVRQEKVKRRGDDSSRTQTAPSVLLEAAIFMVQDGEAVAGS